MTSTPEFYLDLQRVYIKKAEADRTQMATYVQEILGERGIKNATEWMQENEDEFKIFCKNANNLEVTRVRSFNDELKELKVEEDFQWSLHDDEENHLWYVLLRVIEEFRQEHGHYAGLKSEAEDKA